MGDNGPTVPLDAPTFELDASEEIAQGIWAQLVPLDGNCRTYPVIDLIKPEHVFGRSAQCDTVFTEVGISGKHCRIFREAVSAKNARSLVRIEDISTNGTWINDMSIKKQTVLLSPGDTLTFLNSNQTGKLVFVYKPVDAQQDTTGPFQHYRMGEVLGSGQFASVHLCVHKATGKEWAMKVIDKKKFAMSSTTDRPDALLGEVAILKQLDHPGCIGIQEMFETEDALYIVLELVSGGELFDRIIESKRFTEPVAREYFLQMLNAIKYLHGKGIVHRDLKPENILLKSRTENIIKLSDFGLSRVLDSTSNLKTMCGTPQYVAPEILTHGGGDNAPGYGMACDLWSLGVILYILLGGYPPFYEEHRTTKLYDQILNAEFDFPDHKWASISIEAKDLIVQLLTVDVTERISVDNALAHPWMTQGKLNSAYERKLIEAIKSKNRGERNAIRPIAYNGPRYESSSQDDSIATNGKTKTSGSKAASAKATKAAKAAEAPIPTITTSSSSNPSPGTSRKPSSSSNGNQESGDGEDATVTTAKGKAKASNAKATAKATKAKNGNKEVEEEPEEDHDEASSAPAPAAKKTAAAAKKTAKSAASKKAAAAVLPDSDDEAETETKSNPKKRKAAAANEADMSPPKRAKK